MTRTDAGFGESWLAAISCATGSMYAGTGVGHITDVRPVADTVADLFGY